MPAALRLKATPRLPIPSNMSGPLASIIVPLTGGPAQALRCFEGIAAQPPDPAHEVIVVDDASAGLQALLERLDGDVEVVRSHRRLGLAGAVRLGAQAATGQVLVVIRGAASPAAEWLAPLLDTIADPSVGLAASIDADNRFAPLAATWSVALKSDDGHLLNDVTADDHLFAATLALLVADTGRKVRQAARSTIRGPGSRMSTSRRMPGEAPELTIVIPTLDATSHRMRRCLDAVAAATDVAHEIVIVDNGAPPQGFTAPVNSGLRAARAPYVVVMNDDVEPLPGWWEPLRATIDAGAAVAFPLTVDGAMRSDFAAWCFAMGADTIFKFGHAPGEFFDPSLVVWFQDTDLLVALREAGRPPVLVRESQIRHGLSETVATEDPQLSAWVRSQIEADRIRFTNKHAKAPVPSQLASASR